MHFWTLFWLKYVSSCTLPLIYAFLDTLYGWITVAKFRDRSILKDNYCFSLQIVSGKCKLVDQPLNMNWTGFLPHSRPRLGLPWVHPTNGWSNGCIPHWWRGSGNFCQFPPSPYYPHILEHHPAPQNSLIGDVGSWKQKVDLGRVQSCSHRWEKRRDPTQWLIYTTQNLPGPIMHWVFTH